MAEFKKLTTGEVASKRFTPVRMREGYSMDEVDEFLESVEKTIESYEDDLYVVNQEINKLKNAPAPAPVAVDNSELQRVQSELVNSKVSLSESQQQLAALQETVQLMGNQLIEARLAAENAVNNAVSHTGPMDIVGATTTIARMLESAAKSHDDLVAQGEAEALRIRDSAQDEVDALLAAAEAEAKKKQVEFDATRNEVFAGLEGRKRDLEDAVERLRVIERSTREKLVQQYSENLDELRSSPLVVDADPVPAPAAGKHNSFADTPSFNG